MSVIRWEEPPPQSKYALGGALMKLEPAAAALRAHPGEWAVVLEGVTTGTAGPTAGRIRRGLGPFAPEGSFEARSIGPAKGAVCKVYARYVGPRRGER